MGVIVEEHSNTRTENEDGRVREGGEEEGN